jgi:hypothetical protein
MTDIPEWNGDDDTLIEWDVKIAELSRQSQTISTQLGQFVPLRFVDYALNWWINLEDHTKIAISVDWAHLREAITNVWMTPDWFDRMREKALKMRYRDADHSSEKPIDYIFRKSLMLEYTMQGVEFGTIVNYLLDKGGKGWRNILLATPIHSLQEFKDRVKQHERQLLDESNETRLLHDLIGRMKRLEGNHKPRVNALEVDSDLEEPQVNAITPRATFNRKPVGAKPYTKLPPIDPSEPQWITPSDDYTKTTRGFSPEQKMNQPENKGKKFRCRWCWSKKHWGKECKFAEQGRKKLLAWHVQKPKVNSIQVESDEEPYEQLSDEESEHNHIDENNQENDTLGN